VPLGAPGGPGALDIKVPGGLGNNGWTFIEPPPVRVPPAVAPGSGPALTPGGALTSVGVVLFFGALFSGDAPLVTIGPDGIPSNNKGEPYPNAVDSKTGQEVPFPGGVLTIVPKANRVNWGTTERTKFKQEWKERGFQEPPGGWGEVEIHHIKPRSRGGSNDFENLTPLSIDIHQTFTNWWNSY